MRCSLFSSLTTVDSLSAILSDTMSRMSDDTTVKREQHPNRELMVLDPCVDNVICCECSTAVLER